MKAAIIGCGNVGVSLAMLFEKQATVQLAALADENAESATSLCKKLKKHHPKVMTVKDAVEQSDLIVEAASPSAVREILRVITKRQKPKKLLVLSTGGLIIGKRAVKIPGHCEISFPSGAIAGLDAIRAVSGKITSLQLITTKPPSGFAGSAFVKKHAFELSSLRRKKRIFDGNVFEAIRNFPQNINVAASLYFTSHFRNIRVCIDADPDAETNTHHVICKGKFGVIETITRNLPSKNPKTSYLAMLSVQHALKFSF